MVTVNDYLAKRDAEWMGRIYKFLGLSVGIIVHDLDDQERRANYNCRHHLRHQQRIRLRLSARQHEVPPGGLRPARPQLRHRGRSGLHPGGRSAHAADHFRPERRIHRQVLQDQPHHSQADARRRDQGQGAGRKLHHRRLHGGRKASQRGSNRRRHRESREAAGLRQPLPAGELVHAASCPAGAQGRTYCSSATRIIWCKTAR